MWVRFLRVSPILTLSLPLFTYYLSKSFIYRENSISQTTQYGSKYGFIWALPWILRLTCARQPHRPWKSPLRALGKGLQTCRVRRGPLNEKVVVRRSQRESPPRQGLHFRQSNSEEMCLVLGYVGRFGIKSSVILLSHSTHPRDRATQKRENPASKHMP